MSKITFKPSSGTARYDVYVDGALVGAVRDKIESYGGIQGRNGRPLGRYRSWRFEAGGVQCGWWSTRRDAVTEGLTALGIS